ncbi:TolC family protein, partial [Azotobacter chroococcum]|nr:TolC family protein [Azotobacter chroococcum]
PPQPATLKTWLDQAATSNLEVQIQNFSTEIASAELDYNRAGHYPRLEFTASANLDDQSGTMSSFEETGPGQRTNDSYVGLMLTVPIFEGGYVQSKVREAKHAQAASHQKLDDVRKESIEKAREGFINTVVGAKKIETLYSAVTSSQESLRASKLGYGVGVRTAVDVLNAQEQLSSSLRERAKTIYDSIIFSLKLKASVGTLSDEDIMQLRAYTDYSNAPVNNTGF